MDSDEGQAYLNDMTWCQAYALENRMAMLNAVADVVEHVRVPRVSPATPAAGPHSPGLLVPWRCAGQVTGDVPDMSKLINVHHNFCQCESCTFVDPVHGMVP